MPDGTSNLVRYDAACRALVEARSVDEVIEILDRAVALRAYGRQAKNPQLELDAAEIRFRATRRVGEMMRGQRETVGLSEGGRPSKTGSASDPVPILPSLAEAGIDKHLAHRARRMAALPEEGFEKLISDYRHRVEGEGKRVTVDLLASDLRGTTGTGENEWYTPREYIDAARAVMGGIDLDPASSEQANRDIKAPVFYSLERDGLARDWGGRVWMNPPYAQPWIMNFVAKLVNEIESGRVEQAIALTHNYTDTAWFHAGAGVADAICFTRGRIGFLSPAGQRAAPTQGQAFFYFGPNVGAFAEEFGGFGLVMVRHAG